MQVALTATGEIAARAASALASLPSVDRVGLIRKDPPRSWGSRVTRVADASGFEVVIGSDGLALAREAGAVLVVPGDPTDSGPTIAHADLSGLVRCLGVRLGSADATLTRTVREEAGRAVGSIDLPEPLGTLSVGEGSGGVRHAPVEGKWAGVAADAGNRRLAVVDDARFLAAICLAAGALIADQALYGPAAVWEHADRYLEGATDLGLVVAEAVISPER